MDISFLKKTWNSIHREVNERWPTITQGDMEYIGGDKNRLIEVVCNREQLSLEDGTSEVQDFIDRLRVTRNIA
jgi:hypothetical protein